jgi:hypothetical protein
MGRLDDILYQMFRVYRAGNKCQNSKVELARKWAEENDWSIICKQWTDLFEELSDKQGEEIPDEGIKGLVL